MTKKLSSRVINYPLSGRDPGTSGHLLSKRGALSIEQAEKDPFLFFYLEQWKTAPQEITEAAAKSLMVKNLQFYFNSYKVQNIDQVSYETQLEAARKYYVQYTPPWVDYAEIIKGYRGGPGQRASAIAAAEGAAYRYPREYFLGGAASFMPEETSQIAREQLMSHLKSSLEYFKFGLYQSLPRETTVDMARKVIYNDPVEFFDYKLYDVVPKNITDEAGQSIARQLPGAFFEIRIDGDSLIKYFPQEFTILAAETMAKQDPDMFFEFGLDKLDIPGIADITDSAKMRQARNLANSDPHKFFHMNLQEIAPDHFTQRAIYGKLVNDMWSPEEMPDQIARFGEQLRDEKGVDYNIFLKALKLFGENDPTKYFAWDLFTIVKENEFNQSLVTALIKQFGVKKYYYLRLHEKLPTEITASVQRLFEDVDPTDFFQHDYFSVAPMDITVSKARAFASTTSEHYDFLDAIGSIVNSKIYEYIPSEILGEIAHRFAKYYGIGQYLRNDFSKLKEVKNITDSVINSDEVFDINPVDFFEDRVFKSVESSDVLTAMAEKLATLCEESGLNSGVANSIDIIFDDRAVYKKIPVDILVRIGKMYAEYIGTKRYLSRNISRVPELREVTEEILQDPTIYMDEELGNIYKINQDVTKDNFVSITESPFQSEQRPLGTEDLTRYDFALNTAMMGEENEMQSDILNNLFHEATSGEVHNVGLPGHTKSFALISFPSQDSVYLEEIQSDLPPVLHALVGAKDKDGNRTESYRKKDFVDKYGIDSFSKFVGFANKHVRVYPYVLIGKLAEFAAQNDIKEIKMLNEETVVDMAGISNRKKANWIYNKVPEELGFKPSGPENVIYNGDMNELAAKAKERIEAIVGKKMSKRQKRKNTVDLSVVAPVIKKMLGDRAEEVDMTNNLPSLMKSIHKLKQDGKITNKENNHLTALITKHVVAQLDASIIKMAEFHMDHPISKRAKVKSDKPAYKEKKKTDKGYVWVYDEKHVEKRWKEKKDKMKSLEKNLQKVRSKYQSDLTAEDDKTRAIAAIVGIMDDTAMRIGNEDSAKEGTFGATTLKVKHVKGGTGNMTFDFPGKGAIEQNVVLKNNKVIKVIRDLMKGKKANDFIFEIDGNKIWDRAVNRYLKEFGISAKDLRGFHANRLMKDMLKKKDWKEALETVADIVGHEASTLKNQYLDPELVEKHEGKDKKDDKKEKKAAISSRATGQTTEPMPYIPGSEEDFDSIKQPIQSDPNDLQNMVKMVDTNLNVNNAKSAVVFQDPSVQNAWRTIAPFLPPGSMITSAFRDDFEQAKFFVQKWRSWANGWKPRQGFFAKEHPEYDRFVNRIESKIEKEVPFTQRDYARFVKMNNIMRTMAKDIEGYKEFAVAVPGSSYHAQDAAFDVTGASLNKIVGAINFVVQSFPQHIQLRRDPFLEPEPQSAVHVELSRAAGVPDMSQYVPVLYKYLEQENRLAYNQPITKQEALSSPISKRAELTPEDAQWVEKNLKTLSGRAIPDGVEVDQKIKKSYRIRPKVKLNSLLFDAWRTLQPFLPRGAVMTSGFRTPEDQKRILNNYWKKATGSPVPSHLQTDPRVWRQVSRLLRRHHGYIVGPPLTPNSSKKKFGHFKGNCLDISGADLYDISSIVKAVSDHKDLPVKFRKPFVEQGNNCVHIGVVSATYDESAVSSVLNATNQRVASISKIAQEETLEKQIENMYGDLVMSDPPDDLVKEFGAAFDIDASYDEDEGIADGEDELILDMGFGKEDMRGDWFEKSPIFRWREDIPKFELHDLEEAATKKMAEEDPEKFFYRGLHREYPKLEALALENMIEDNAKFFFIFLYHEREEDSFQDLVEKAAEALSLQDARAFFYYHLHHKFPELGRGAIIQLIDTNPDTFFDLGLQKDYPDLEESAGNARNIKDPNKVELEQPEWLKKDIENPISLRDRNAKKLFSKRAGESPKIQTTPEEEKVFQVLEDTIKHFRLGTNVRVAGGWVRDKLMGLQSKDIDIAIDNMMGKQFAEYVGQYARSMGIEATAGVIPAKPEQGKHLETAVIHMFGESIDVVNLRDEEYDEESRKPVVTITDSPMKDAFRRDLTINALFYNIHTKEVEDFTGQGLTDIEDKVLRTPQTISEEQEQEVGRPIDAKQIYLDDPLRVMRAVRFANRYPEFKIDPEIPTAAKDPEVQEAFRTKITFERRQDELKKIFQEKRSPREALELIKDWGYRSEILQLPDQYSEWELDQNNPHHEFHVWGHLMEALDNIYQITEGEDLDKADRYILNWATLLHDVGKLDPNIQGAKEQGDQIINTFHGHENSSIEAAQHILGKLKGTKSKDIKRVQSLIDSARRVDLDPEKAANIKAKTIRKILEITKDFEGDWRRAMQVALADAAAHKGGWLPTFPREGYDHLVGQFQKVPPETLTPLISGMDLQNMFGRRPGRWIGQINKDLQTWQTQMATQGAAPTADDAKQFVQTFDAQNIYDEKRKEYNEPVVSLVKEASQHVISKRAEDTDIISLPSVSDINEELGNLPGAFPQRDERTSSGQLDISEGVSLLWNYFIYSDGTAGPRYGAVANLQYATGALSQYIKVFSFTGGSQQETLEQLQSFLMDQDLHNKMTQIIVDKEKSEEDGLAEVIPLFGKKLSTRHMVNR